MTHAADDSNESRMKQSLGGKYLTFGLADGQYGLEILKVREINGMMGIKAIPRMPEFVKGVINPRGKVIPVIDLRLRFGMPAAEVTEQTCIIVVDVGYLEMGIIVDHVSEVLDIPSEDIEPPPSFGVSVDTQFILGTARANGEVKTLLDIERVLSGKDLADVSLAEASAG